MCWCNTGSNSKNVVSKGVGNPCAELYEILRTLDLRVLDLLTIEPKEILLDTNRQLRMWMRNLNKYCPTEEELNTVEAFISMEENNIKNK